MARIRRLLLLSLASLLVLGSTGFKNSAQTAIPLDEQCKAYGDEVVPLVLQATPWDLDELMRRASPEFIRVASPDQVELLFRPFNNFLGALVRHGEAQVDVTIRRRSEGVTVLCQYQAPGTFENYTAAIVLQMILRDGQWQILSLRLNFGGPPETPQPSTT
jgi:hypothetical protein